MQLTFTEMHTPTVGLQIQVDRQLYTEQSDFQRIDVFECEEFGRFLTLDGYMMLTERDEFIYHEMMVHVPLAVLGEKMLEQRDLVHGTSSRFHGLLHSGARYAVKDAEAGRECIEENRILRRIGKLTAERYKRRSFSAALYRIAVIVKSVAGKKPSLSFGICRRSTDKRIIYRILVPQKRGLFGKHLACGVLPCDRHGGADIYGISRLPDIYADVFLYSTVKLL